ncbi:MAG: quinonprotein alcohol dehydrogenase [Planctomycetes bacterium]|nr:quinonprotein alcohol dehydrogenase [Planctomycetota bacterium]
MLLLELLAPVALATLASTHELAWPDYRGPTRDGHAAAARLPLEWSEKKNVRWKSEITGVGWSSPIVGEGRIWITTATEDGKLMKILGLDLETGALLVQRVLFENEKPEEKNALNSYASPSCVLERGRVYVHFGTYGTACLDTQSGETIWERRDINCDHMEGPGSSPVLWNSLLIMNVDGGDVQYVTALDKKTGETRWKTDRTVKLDHLPADLRKAYSTPILIDVDGKPRLFSSGAEATVAYDPENGEPLWTVRHAGFSMSSRPVTDGEVVFLNTGFFKAGLVAVRIEGEGDVTDENVLWNFTRGVPLIPSPLLIDGRIYFTSNGGIATCLDTKTGESVWKERIGGEHCASPIYASGRIYFFDREGRTVVIAPDDDYRVLATNELDHGFMASPAVVQDALILRTKKHLYRIEQERSE